MMKPRPSSSASGAAIRKPRLSMPASRSGLYGRMARAEAPHGGGARRGRAAAGWRCRRTGCPASGNPGCRGYARADPELSASRRRVAVIVSGMGREVRGAAWAAATGVAGAWPRGGAGPCAPPCRAPPSPFRSACLASCSTSPRSWRWPTWCCPMHWLVQALYFLVAGVAWAWPAQRLMYWAARKA